MTLRPGEHVNSVKRRMMDLLETHPGDWFSIDQLVVEYSERFGEVKLDTLRRAVFRELEQDDCGMFVRYVERFDRDEGSYEGQPHTHLEVAWRIGEKV